MRFPKMIIKNSTQQFIISNILEHALSWKKVTFGKIARVLIFSDMYKTRTFVFFSFFLINKIIKKIAKQGLIEQIRTS